MIGKKQLTKLLLSISGLFGAGLIAFSVTSCDGVSQRIKDNIVGKGDGTQFADGYSLSDEVKKALLDKTSTDAFKKTIANTVLYGWYQDCMNNTALSDRQTYKDNWDKWIKDAKSSYDDKVKDYKSNHGSDWQYYFQNEILDPIGADGGQQDPITNKTESPQETYVRFQMYNNIRTAFDGKVWANNYFGLGTTDRTANGYIIDSPVVSKDSAYSFVDNTLLQHPENWQNIDFYPSTRQGYSPTSNIDWQFAYMQHIAFVEYTQTAMPISTSMVLWKGIDKPTNPAFSSVYNVYDATLNPDGTVKDVTNPNYNFPLFKTNAAENNFANFATNGFSGANPTYFFDTSSTTPAPYPTKLINVPCATTSGKNNLYTDDGATLIKVNLGTDAFTTLDTTFSATASDLWKSVTSQANPVSINSFNPKMPLYTNGTTTKVLPNTTDLLKNFLYTDPTATPSGDNGLPVSLTANAQVLGTTYDSTGAKSTITYSATGGSLDQKITEDTTNGVHAEIFNHNSDFYKKGYTDIVSAFQLSDPNNSNAPLPMVLIRERSGGDSGTGGVHMIGLDGSGYLTMVTGAIPSKTLRSAPKTQARENDILKMRALQSSWEGSTSRYSDSFDFTGSDVKTYFTNNEDTIILQLANKMTGISYGDTNLGSDYATTLTGGHGDIFPLPSVYTSELWTDLLFITQQIDKINIFQAVVKNLSDSYDKMVAFNSAESKNLKFNGVNGPVQGTDTYATADVYKNGLASMYPFTGRWQGIATWCDIPEITSNRVFFDSESYLVTPLTAIRASGETSIELIENNLFNSAQWTAYNNKLSDSAVAKATSGMAVYSENIFTRMAEVNTLLNTFGVNSNFSNSVLVDAYKNYLTTGATNFLDNDGKFINSSLTDLNNVLASNLYLPTVVSTPNDLLKINAGGTSITADGGLTTLSYNSWKNSKMIDPSWGTASTSGYSNDQLTYYKTLAAIKFLMSGYDAGNTYKNFIDYSINRNSNLSYGTQNTFVWQTQDSIDYQDAATGNNFGIITQATDLQPTSSILDLYKMKANYNDVMDDRLDGITTGLNSGTYGSATFVDNTSALKFANCDNNQLMGYKGLVSNGSGLSSGATAALTNNFIEGNPYKSLAQSDANSYKGSLYQYTTIGQYVNVDTNQYWDGTAWQTITPVIRNAAWFQNSLTGYIYNNKDNLANVISLATIINHSIPNFNDIYSKISSNIDPYTNTSASWTQQKQAQALITCISDPTNITRDPFATDGPSQANITALHFKWNNANSALKDQFFSGINAANGARELVNPDSSMYNLNPTVFYDNGIDKNNSCSRFLFEQIRNTDFYTGTGTSLKAPATTEEYQGVMTNLIAKYGISLIMNMVYDASSNTWVTSQTTTIVRNLFTQNGQSKLAVYDRRYNDQLGYNWVKNYKEKN